MSENTKIPCHVAIIMDGNGRWAQRQGKERMYGHIQGVESVRTVLKAARERGIKYLTMYAFSTENWGRPAEEVNALMELLCKSIMNETEELCRQNVAVKIVGEKEGLNPSVREHIRLIEEKTSKGKSITLILAINYSSRSEITHTMREIINLVAAGKLDPDDITPDTISSHLMTAEFPDPDLIIRTSGEYRLSNFLLWQSAYSEFYFTEVLWPDFGAEELEKALEAYSKRERRYGRVNKMINAQYNDR